MYSLSVCVDDQPVGENAATLAELDENDLTGFADADAFGENAAVPRSVPEGRAKPARGGSPVSPMQVGGVMGAAVARANLGGLRAHDVPAPQRAV